MSAFARRMAEASRQEIQTSFERDLANAVRGAPYTPAGVKQAFEATMTTALNQWESSLPDEAWNAGTGQRVLAVAFVAMKDAMKQDYVNIYDRILRDYRPEREVVLGRSGLFAGHWAVRVGCQWYEALGEGGKKQNARTVIQEGAAPEEQAERHQGVMGRTNKTLPEISWFTTSYQERHPNFNITWTNCQSFAKEFIHWLTGGQHFPFPNTEAARAQRFDTGPVAMTGDREFRASLGAVEGNHGLLGYQVVGPSFGSQSRNGAGIEASLFSARLNLGPVGEPVTLRPNVDTGVGAGFLKVAGFGFDMTQGRFKLQSPLGDFHLF